MRHITSDELNGIPESHRKRGNAESGGAKADLGENDLTQPRAALAGLDLSCASFRADFTGANLRGSNMYRACLNEANFSGADLSGANMRQSQMRDAGLSGAKMAISDDRAVLHDVRSDASELEIGKEMTLAADAEGFSAVQGMGAETRKREGVRR
jgi:hypothetical protein